MDKQDLRNELVSQLPVELVNELLDAHEETKRAYYLGGLRLAEVEGGRFCEAAFRLLESVTTGSYTPLGKQVDTDKIIRQLSQLAVGSFPDSIRLHIPRSLRVVYDIRNKRDAAHLGDDIDPNVQDSSLVCSVIDWVLAEFIRLYHNVSADETTQIVDDIVAKAAPLIQDFDGFLKVLDPSLGASDYCLVLLYQRGKHGAVFEEIEQWVQPSMRPNLRRTLNRLVNVKAFLHQQNSNYIITRTGELDVENRQLLEP